MSFLTQIALHKRWLTFLLVALITLGSIWAILCLKMELIPNIEPPVTTVWTVYPKASPEEVMDGVTIPVESAISDMDDLRHLLSTSAENVSFVLAEFEFGTDMGKVNSAISENLSQLQFPPGARQPQLLPINVNILPTVVLSLSGNRAPEELQHLAATGIVPRLKNIEGVYDVILEGGGGDQVLIALDPEKMNQSGISMSQLV